MMWNFCELTEQTARKDYNCDASEWVCNSGIWMEDMTLTERKHYIRAKRNGFNIKKGDRYVKVSGKWEGEFAVFRAIPEMNDVCNKHELYAE